MTDRDEFDWTALSRRISRSVQTTIGWIFWDPGAVARYEKRGLQSGLGYIAARSAPFASAGPEALSAALGSISPLGIAVLYQLLEEPSSWMDFWHLRNEAVREGLVAYAPEIVEHLIAFGPELWEVVHQLPLAGRPFVASHLALPIPDDPLLSSWHAVNFIREWRGDTHWAIVASHNLSGNEASILHNAWLGYEGDWLSLSRGNSPEDIERAWSSLENRGLATSHLVNELGLQLRQSIEDETDRICALPWQLLGTEKSKQLIEEFEPPCEKLLRRVDETAGTNYQPASRLQGNEKPQPPK